jgi:hypothetical protein
MEPAKSPSSRRASCRDLRERPQRAGERASDPRVIASRGMRSFPFVRLALALTCLASCAGRQSGPSSPSSVSASEEDAAPRAEPVAPDVARAPETAPVGDAGPPFVGSHAQVLPTQDAGASAPDSALADEPHRALLRRLVAGTLRWSDAVDPQRGVLFIESLEPSPSGRSTRSTARSLRVCAVNPMNPDITRALRDALAQADANDVWSCEGAVCAIAGMEFQPAWRILFTGSSEAPRLEALARFSEAALSPAARARHEGYVEAGLRAFRAQPCRSPR